jgi:hypothetical protein
MEKDHGDNEEWGRRDAGDGEDSFPLGLEERGVEMNHSGQVRSAAFLENVTAYKICYRLRHVL